jgi:transposase
LSGRSHAKQGKPFPPDVRERALQMVLDHGGEYESQWAAIVSISEKFGITAATLHRNGIGQQRNRDVRIAAD